VKTAVRAVARGPGVRVWGGAGAGEGVRGWVGDAIFEGGGVVVGGSGYVFIAGIGDGVWCVAVSLWARLHVWLMQCLRLEIRALDALARAE